jgi:hypothetical protein
MWSATTADELSLDVNVDPYVLVHYRLVHYRSVTVDPHVLVSFEVVAWHCLN